MNWKKYIKISVVIVIIGGIVFVSYLFFRNTEVFDNVATTLFGDDEPTITTPVIQNIEALTDNEIFDYWINTSNNSIYYLAQSGEVIKISNRNQEVLNSQTLNKLNSVQSSYNGTKIVAKFNYPNLPTFSIFDTSTKNWTPLPSDTIATAWSPNSDELVYLDSNSLNIYNPATKKSTTVLSMTQKEVGLDWTSESEVLLSTLPSIDNPSSLWSINLKTKRLTKLINEEAGLTVNWSDDGSLGLKLHNEKRVPFTSLIDSNGNTLATFSFVTMPSKCTFDGSKIYCAIPNNINEGVDFPDDFYKRAVYFDDGFYLIDIEADSATILSNPDNLFIDADHLELFGNNLLFKNRIDEKLYSLKLE